VVWERNSSSLGADHPKRALAVGDKAVHRDAHRVDQHGFKLVAPERRTIIVMTFTIELDIGRSFLLQHETTPIVVGGPSDRTAIAPVAIAGQYGPVSKSLHRYDERVDVESVCPITRGRSLSSSPSGAGPQAPLSFPAYSPTQTEEIRTDLASATFPDRDTWRSRLLNYVDEHAMEIVTDLAGLVRMPSVSGSVDEIAIQHVLSDRMITMDLDVEAWQISREETLAEPDFPGV